MKIAKNTLLISKLSAFLANRSEIRFAYLFGSVAKGTSGRLSDLDLAVFLDPSYDFSTNNYGYQSIMTAELSKLMAKKIDLIILNNASTMIKYQVIKNGILIYSRSKAEHRSFHEKTIQQYLDFKPFLKIHSEYMRKRLAEGTFGGIKNG